MKFRASSLEDSAALIPASIELLSRLLRQGPLERGPSLRSEIVVEVDGAFHARQRSADARRDAKLTRLGYRVVRISIALLDGDPGEALRRIREAL